MSIPDDFIIELARLLKKHGVKRVPLDATDAILAAFSPLFEDARKGEEE